MSRKAAPWFAAVDLTVLGTGAAFPGAALSTDELISALERRFAFAQGRKARALAEQLGVATRHVCRPFERRIEAPRAGEGNAALAAAALKQALQAAGLEAADLGYLIGHTATPDRPLPPNIAAVADALHYPGPFVELRQACTGFANALVIAAGLLAGPYTKPVAIVGSETGSVFFDPEAKPQTDDQLVNLVQMGDGAGAIILQRTDKIAGPPSGRISHAWFGTIGLGKSPGLSMPAGGAEHPASPTAAPLLFAHDFAMVRAEGPALFLAGAAAYERTGEALAEADLLIPHQASGRIGAQLAAHFDRPAGQVFVNADRVGNCGSAAIWIAFDEARRMALAPGATAAILGAEATKHMYGGFRYVA